MARRKILVENGWKKLKTVEKFELTWTYLKTVEKVEKFENGWKRLKTVENGWKIWQVQLFKFIIFLYTLGFRHILPLKKVREK